MDRIRVAPAPRHQRQSAGRPTTEGISKRQASRRQRGQERNHWEHTWPSSTRVCLRAPNEVTEVAQRDAAIPFDVVNVELGHKGADCSFDAVIRKYNLTDPALVKLAVIVRGADTDAKDLAPECRGLRRLLTAFGWLTKTIMSYWNVNFRFTTRCMPIAKKLAGARKYTQL